MPLWLGILLFIVTLTVLVWLLTGCTSSPAPLDSAAGKSESHAEKGVDLTDDVLVGKLIGLSGGTIADAAEARFDLEHFEKSTGRKATAQDLGFILGMESTLPD